MDWIPPPPPPADHIETIDEILAVQTLKDAILAASFEPQLLWTYLGNLWKLAACLQLNKEAEKILTGILLVSLFARDASTQTDPAPKASTSQATTQTPPTTRPQQTNVATQVTPTPRSYAEAATQATTPPPAQRDQPQKDTKGKRKETGSEAAPPTRHNQVPSSTISRHPQPPATTATKSPATGANATPVPPE